MYLGVTEGRRWHRRSWGNCTISPGLGTQDKNHQSHHVFFKHIELTSKSIEKCVVGQQKGSASKGACCYQHDGLSCLLHPHFWKLSSADLIPVLRYICTNAHTIINKETFKIFREKNLLIASAMVWVRFENLVPVSMPRRHGPWCGTAVVATFSKSVFTHCAISRTRRI